jgi:hypothetical protein
LMQWFEHFHRMGVNVRCAKFRSDMDSILDTTRTSTTEPSHEQGPAALIAEHEPYELGPTLTDDKNRCRHKYTQPKGRWRPKLFGCSCDGCSDLMDFRLLKAQEYVGPDRRDRIHPKR